MKTKDELKVELTAVQARRILALLDAIVEPQVAYSPDPLAMANAVIAQNTAVAKSIRVALGGDALFLSLGIPTAPTEDA